MPVGHQNYLIAFQILRKTNALQSYKCCMLRERQAIPIATGDREVQGSYSPNNVGKDT